MRRSTRYLAAAAAALLLASCSDAFPWHRPAVVAFVSESLPPCPASDSACVVLAPLARDSALLANTAGSAPARRSLERATGFDWKSGVNAERDLHVDFDPPPEGQTRSVYVLEVLHSPTARDSVLSIASNGGAVVWLNGTLLGASRSAARSARAHQDLYSARLRAGDNLLLYRVQIANADAQLHREWHPRTSLPDLLAAAIDLGAYTTLALSPLLPDTATSLPLLPPQIRLERGPVVHFRWLSLLGEPIAEAGEYPEAYPPALPLPPGFDGMAVLETRVTDAGSGRQLYLEQSPVFTDSAALGLARALTRDTATADPIRAARLDAVRAAFDLGPEPRGPAQPVYNRVHVLASLYRHVRQPNRFHLYPGPQVWGYRAADGSVVPYWLTVPPAALQPGADTVTARPGLVFSVTHHIHEDFWQGRGRVVGFLVHLATMGSSYGTFGVMPQLGGIHDFDTLAVAELPAITRQVASVFPIDTSAIGILAWSSHALESVQLAHDPRVSISWLGLAVPAMYRDPAELDRALDSLRVLRPGLHWVVWQASEDDRIPRASTEAWVKAVKDAGFDMHYREVPHSTHLGGYFDDIEAELHRRIARRYQGAAGRAALAQASRETSGGLRP